MMSRGGAAVLIALVVIAPLALLGTCDPSDEPAAKSPEPTPDVTRESQSIPARPRTAPAPIAPPTPPVDARDATPQPSASPEPASTSRTLRLLDASGAPVAGPLKVQVVDGSRGATDITPARGGDGVFTLTPPVGTAADATFRLDVAGFRLVESAKLPPGTTTEIRLERGSTVRGRVRDARGAPIANAQIALGRVRSSPSAVDGTFTIEGVAPGRFTQVPVVLGAGQLTGTCDIAVGDQPAEITADVTVPSLFEQRIQVVTADPALPLAGLRVTMASIDGGPTARGRAVTDAAGEATVASLRPGDYWCLVEGDGVQAATVPCAFVPGDATLRVSVERMTPTIVTGRVRRSDGTPAIGAKVSSTHAVPQGGVTTGADGEFRIALASPSWAHGAKNPVPHLSRRHLQIHVRGTTPLEVPVDGAGPLDIVVDAPVPIRGTVKDATGAPLGEYTLRFVAEGGVAADKGFTSPDATATFDWRDVPNVPGVLEAHISGGRIGRVSLGAGDRSRVLIEVPLLAALRVDAADAEGLRSGVAQVIPRTRGAAARTEYVYAKTGWLAPPTLEQGTFGVSVVMAGRLCSPPQEVRSDGSGTCVVRVACPRPASLTVLVVRNGEPLPGTTVEILPGADAAAAFDVRGISGFGPNGAAQVITGRGMSNVADSDRDGVCWFRRLPPGEYRVKARRADGAAERTVRIDEGTDTILTLPLER